MSLPPVIHVTALRNAVTPAGEWTAAARSASTPYVPAAALEAAQARIAALEEALVTERLDVLWNAYNAGIERDGKWMDGAMSDAEWLRDQLGIEEEGWVDAETVKALIPAAARAALAENGG